MADSGVGHGPTHESFHPALTSLELLGRLNLSLTSFVIGLTVWSRILYARSIPIFSLIDYDTPSPSALRKGLDRIALLLLANLVTVTALEHGSSWIGLEISHPLFLRFPSLVVTCLVIFSPMDISGQPRPGNANALVSLLRCLSTRMAPKGAGKFGDLLLSDSLVSLSRVMYELGCLGARALGASDDSLDRSVPGWLAFTALTAWPLIIRAAQCYRDWLSDRSKGDHTQAFNMAKYCTSIVAVSLARLVNVSRPAQGDAATAQWTALLLLWRFVALFAAGFSLYWDIAKDWGLELFDAQKWRRTGGLRRHLLLGPPLMYAALVVFDALARFPWIAPGEAYVVRYAEWTTTIVVLVEVVRRLVWCGFRAEWEYLKGRPDEDVVVGNGAILLS